jgi:hypothetical protein
MRTIESVLAAVAVAAGLALATDVGACTAFLVASDSGVLFGNNEDFWNPETRMWFVPAEEGQHGAVYFGFDDLSPQGGMNDAGLAFDGFATAPKPVTGSAGKEPFEGNLVLEAMAGCATVDEVIAVFERHDLAMMERFMLMFADATGASVIIEGDEIIRKKGPFQVVTNFYQSDSPDGKNAYGTGRACTRFETANDMLRASQEVGVERAREILDAVRAEGQSKTLYSNVYDLEHRLVHLWSFHAFDHEVVIDLAKELDKGAHVVDLPTLFPANPARERFVAEQEQALEERRRARGSVPLAAEVLERYVGAYGGASGEVEVAVDGGALLLSAPGQPPLRVTPTSRTTFFEATLMLDYEVEFRVGEDGAVKGADIRVLRDDFVAFNQFLERVESP